MVIKLILLAVVFAGTFALSVVYNVGFTYSDFKSYADVLLNVSGAVFTLMGIWIAFLYPNALSRIVDPEKIATADFSESLQESKRLAVIVGCVMKSAIVVLTVLSMMLAKLFVANSPFLMAHLMILKQAALSVAVLLFFLQAEAVIGVIFANIMFINDLHTKREDKQINEEI